MHREKPNKQDAQTFICSVATLKMWNHQERNRMSENLWPVVQEGTVEEDLIALIK